MSHQSTEAPASLTRLTPESHHNKPEEHEEKKEELDENISIEEVLSTM